MDEEKTNRPKDNALFQQKLKAWTPMLTMKDASIFFIVTGLVVIGVGLAIFFSDNAVLQYSVDYTKCKDMTSGVVCADNYTVPCTCNVTISVDANMTLPVFFYYGMTNYYQNHRQFINSIDMNQLTGSLTTPSNSCFPILNDANGSYYAPCGQMANALFNDTFILTELKTGTKIPWTKTNISMDSDRKRYGNPLIWTNTVKPPNWKSPIQNRSNDGYRGDEELLVWLRASPLPTFRKLHRILPQNSSSQYSKELSSGNYSLIITYNYPVKSFEGTKSFIISTVSWIGGKNPALGILYLVTGALEIVIGLIIFVFWMKSKNQIQEPDASVTTSMTKF